MELKGHFIIDIPNKIIQTDDFTPFYHYDLSFYNHHFTIKSKHSTASLSTSEEQKFMPIKFGLMTPGLHHKW